MTKEIKEDLRMIFSYLETKDAITMLYRSGKKPPESLLDREYTMRNMVNDIGRRYGINNQE